MDLRPYQQEAFDNTLKGFAEFNRQLGVLATGGGKTIIFSKLAEHYANVKKGRALIMADTDELVEQAVDKLYKSTGIYASVEKADSRASLNASVVVGSIQTISRENRLSKFPIDHFSLVVADEAHKSLADMWQRTLNRFGEGGAKILGVTATPGRQDKRSLMGFYENIAFETGLFDLVRMGYLAPIKVRTVPVKIDIQNVSKTGGDYDVEELDGALQKYFDEICGAIKQYAPDRKILVFLPLIKTSKAFRDACIRNGIPAAHIDGNSDDRKETLRAFKDNRFQVLCNSMLLTTGFDEPSIDCIINLRCTQSSGLYQQIIGRGTRLFETKKDLLILDFLWQFNKYALMRPADLIAKTESVNEALTRKLETASANGEVDLMAAEQETIREQEKALLKSLAKQKRRQSNAFDALEWAAGLHDQDLIDYEPLAVWEGKRPSEAQMATLQKFGIDPATIKYKGQASKILDTLFRRMREGKATAKQMKWLIRWNIPNADKLTLKEASAIMDERFNRDRKPATPQTPRPPAPAPVAPKPPVVKKPEPQKETSAVQESLL